MLQFKQGTAFMKAALPFVDPVAREKLGLMIQAGELIGSMEQMAEMPLSACDFNSTPIDIEGMLSAFLPLCSGQDHKLLEQMLGWIRIRKFWHLYQSVSQDGGGGSMMDILMQQLSPEQQEMFQNYQIMFEAMNN